jgi:polysaccharide biosynthesis PFTS motif protein
MNIRIVLISKLIRKRKRSKLRAINKGYRQLKNEGKLDFLMQLKNTLSRTKIESVSFNVLSRQGDFDDELSIRQFFTRKFLGLLFNKSVLYSIGTNTPLKHPLPKEWRDVLIVQGVSINNFSCAVLWHAYGFIFWGYGALKGFNSIRLLLKKQTPIGKYVYFDGLNSDNISTNSDSYNIVNWYLQWKGRASEVGVICHSASVTHDFRLSKVAIVKTDGLPRLKSFKLFKYTVFIIYRSFYDLLRLPFKPIYGLLLEDFIKLKRIELADDIDLAKDYLFHNSSPFYRPIWTYLAEERGARLLFYFYSTNVEMFKKKETYPMQNPWHLISWPHYLVWDNFQTNFVKEFDLHNSTIEEVGPIWFSSNDINVDAPLNSIAVFDVSPTRPTRYALLGCDQEYYVADIANQFLSDVQFILYRNSINMTYKMKRINKFIHKRYTRKIKQLSMKSNFIMIDPSVDALQIIKKSKACISMPFTSTAITAKLEGKPSVYYDPSGVICKDDRAAHGIPVLSNINELQEWVKKFK